LVSLASFLMLCAMLVLSSLFCLSNMMPVDTRVPLLAYLSKSNRCNTLKINAWCCQMGAPSHHN
jgi:hypothetical protein